MSSIKIKLVELVANMKSLDQVLMTFVDLKGVHPVLSLDIVSKVHGFTSLGSESPCDAMLEDLEDIEKKYQIEIPNQEIKQENYNFNQMYDFIHEFKEKISSDSNKITDLTESIQKYKDALIQVNNIQSLDIVLDDLFACEYVFFRFGKIPNDSLEKIKVFMNKPFVFRTFSSDRYKTWVMYYTTSEYKREVDNIFSSMLFERVMIPDFVHGKPSKAIEALMSENESTQLMIDKYESEKDEFIAKNIEKLREINGTLLFLKRVFSAKKYVLCMGSKFMISNFVKETEVDHFRESFKHILEVEIEVKESHADGRITLPKRIKEKWFTI